MVNRRVVPVAVVCWLGLGLGACSGDDGDGGAAQPGATPPTATSAAPTTSAGPGTSTSAAPTSGAPTSGAPATTTSEGPTSTSGVAPPAGACPPLASLPADAEGSGAREADVDDDGLADQVLTYSVGASPGAGDWRLRVELGAGGGAEYTLPEDPAPAAFQVLGTSYVGSTVDPGPGGLRPLIFAWVNSGASAKVVALYRLDGCALVPVAGPGGGPASFIAGGSIGHQEGARCDGVAGTSLFVEVLSEAADAGYEVTEQAYTRNGNALQTYGQPLVSSSAGPPPEAGKILCGDVTLD
jgi:hypothetical protein